MKLHHHTAFSLALSGILYMIFKSWSMAVSCLISGIFIDLDHIIDVAREHGWPIKVKQFFQVCRQGRFHKIVLLLHGWELLLLWGIASWLTGWNPWLTGAFVGFSTHLILDAFYNSTNIFTYSLIWRWKKGFHFDTIFPNLKNNKYRHRKSYTDRS